MKLGFFLLAVLLLGSLLHLQGKMQESSALSKVQLSPEQGKSDKQNTTNKKLTFEERLKSFSKGLGYSGVIALSIGGVHFLGKHLIGVAQRSELKKKYSLFVGTAVWTAAVLYVNCEFSTLKNAYRFFKEALR